jgi:2-iminobutanoate/2-iminopropanoate deaminase
MRSSALILCCLLAGCATRPPTVHVAAPGAIGPYSAAVRSGELVFFSGRIGATKGAFELEVETTIRALQLELEKVGLGLADLVSVTVYLTDMGAFEAMNKVYAALLPAPYPARTTVGVSALPAGARIEIQGIARARAH